MYAKAITSKEHVLFGVTVLAALMVVKFYNSSPALITLLSLGLAILVPLIVKYTEYGAFMLAFILAFPCMNIKFISILGVNRVLIWGLLGYIAIRQMSRERYVLQSNSEIFVRFRNATVVFILALLASSLRTAAELNSSTYITMQMVKTTFLAHGLTAVEAILVAYIFYYLFDSLRKIYNLLLVMGVASTVIACLGIAQYYYGAPPPIVSFLFDSEYQFYGRATSVFSNPNGLGAFVAPVVSIAIGYFFLGTMDKLKRGGLLVLICVNMWGLTLSFSRSAAVQVLFGIVVLSLGYCLKINRMQLTLKFIVTVIAVTIILGLSAQYYTLYLRARAISCGARDYRTALFQLSEKNNSYREQAALKALETFTEYPLLGIGHNLFSAKGKAGLALYGLTAHNQFLEILAEMGLFGFIPFLLMLIFTIKAGIHIWDKHKKLPVEREAQVFMLLLLIGFSSNILGWLFADSLDFIPLSGYLWMFSGTIFALERQYAR